MKRNQIKTWATVGLLTLATTLQAVTIKNDTPYNLRIQLYEVDRTNFRSVMMDKFKNAMKGLFETGYMLTPGQTYDHAHPNLDRMGVRLARGPYGGAVVVRHRMEVGHDFNSLEIHDNANCRFVIEDGRVQLKSIRSLIAWLS